MGLVNLQTNLKSLKFGNDRVNGGSSKQPYIQTPIPDKIGEFGFLNTDFLLRGGSKAVTDSVTDVVRLGKYFTDIRNPSGLLFIAKQNLLSRTAVRTQASGKLVNEGVYTPLSTLIEAGGVAFGLHVNKQGLNPFDGVGSLRTYSDVITPELGAAFSIKNVDKNRLIDLYKSNVNPLPFKVGKPETTLNLDPILREYNGGPGSILGVGKTLIRKATNTSEGLQTSFPQASDGGIKVSLSKENINLTRHIRVSEKYEFYIDSSFDPIIGNGFSADGRLTRIFGPLDNNQTFSTNPDLLKLYQTQSSKKIIDINGNKLLGLSVSSSFSNLLSGSKTTGFTIDGTIDSTFRQIGELNNPNQTLSTNYLPDIATDKNTSITYTQDELNKLSSDPQSVPSGESFIVGRWNSTSEIGDFRKKLRNTAEGSPSTFQKQLDLGLIPLAPNYAKKNIEQRVNLGTPGDTTLKNLVSYVSGKDGTGAASKTSYDKINHSKIYSTEGLGSNASFGTEKNDLVKFAISVIDTKQNKTKHIHFRAFLNQISDGYTAEWQDTKYIGRGEKFYNYTGFDRKVSLSWTVAAQSKIELIPMYKKLNYLASVCAPNYSGDGYMQGNIVKLTVGGYFYEQPGIITGFNYEMNDDNATWEIGINDEDESGYDSSVKELPHLIKVSGFNFIPIHTFVPRLVQNENTGTEERFIALANGIGLENTNYKA